jgi:hypothetical protein
MAVFFNLVRMPSIVNNGALVLGNYESHEIYTPPSEKKKLRISSIRRDIIVFTLGNDQNCENAVISL